MEVWAVLVVVNSAFQRGRLSYIDQPISTLPDIVVRGMPIHPADNYFNPKAQP